MEAQIGFETEGGIFLPAKPCKCLQWPRTKARPHYLHHPECYRYNKEYEILLKRLFETAEKRAEAEQQRGDVERKSEGGIILPKGVKV